MLPNQHRQSTEGLSIIVQWKEVWLATVVYRYCDCTGHCPVICSVNLIVVCVLMMRMLFCGVMLLPGCIGGGGG